MTANVLMVAGLGFGDEGKGSIVDYLTRKHNAGLVVRYNGGAQAAHNVVTADGLHHTFSQFGSGTLAGAKTFLSRFMLVHPESMLNEAAHLRDMCHIENPLGGVFVAEDAVIITPHHIAANRYREAARDIKHGTCGMGIGETRQDELSGLALRVADIGTMFGKAILREIAMRRVSVIRHNAAAVEDQIASQMSGYERWAAMVNIVDGQSFLTTQLRTRGTPIIFEGAQGVLLDETHGCQPHTTWTNCTFDNACRLLLQTKEPFPKRPRFIGVLRTYATRHGAGPLPTEDAAINHPEPHNGDCGHQGAFRQGHFDMALAAYAMNRCHVEELAITHVDRLHPFNNALMLSTPAESHWTADRVRVNADRHDFVPAVESMLDVPVTITSSGPTADDKEDRWQPKTQEHSPHP